MSMGSLKECTPFPGYITANGYGNIRRGHKTLYAHRWYYEMAHGPIPEGYWIDHLCRVRSCVNPLHLEAVPPGVNTARGMAPSAVTARTGVCQKGHVLEGRNIVIIKTSGKRRCRTCENARARLYAQRKREATR